MLLNFRIDGCGANPVLPLANVQVRFRHMATGESAASFSIPSLIAIGAAIASFFVGALGGLILALVAIVFGIIGVVMSLSPSVRGGLVSVLSIFAAAIAIVVAVAKAIAWAL